MKAEPKPFSLQSAAKAMLAAVMVCSVLFASILAVDHHLHRSVHADADHPDHQCLAVLLSQGGLELTGLAAVVVVVAGRIASQPRPAQTFLPLPPSYRLLPGRAPPFSVA